MDIRKIQAGPVPLAVRTHGEGPPIVCLHATGHSGRDFERLALRMGDRFRFYAPDFPGQGESPPDTVPASAARYAALLPDLFRALGLQSAVLLGNSIGGAAAIEFAAAHPDRVAGLVLCNSGGLAPGGLIPRLYCNRVARRFEKGAAGDAGFPAWFASYYAKILSGAGADWRRGEIVADGPRTARVLAEAWRSFAAKESDIRHLVPKLQMPVWYAWAKDDKAVRWSWAKKAALTAPVHRVTLFDGGHSAFLEAPDAFDTGLLSFLSDCVASHAEAVI